MSTEIYMASAKGTIKVDTSLFLYYVAYVDNLCGKLMCSKRTNDLKAAEREVKRMREKGHTEATIIEGCVR